MATESRYLGKSICDRLADSVRTARADPNYDRKIDQANQWAMHATERFLQEQTADASVVDRECYPG